MKNRSSEAGFTLVEALVAIVILVFGLIAVTNLMLVAASSNSVANQATAAATVAAQRLELLKAQPFTSLAVGGDLDSDVTNFNQDDDVAGVGRIHTRWTVVSISGDAQVYFVAVRSEGTGALSVGRSRAEFTTFRSCTNVALGCPNP
ncbi:MAG TPA: type II secretion system protein [Gemmatimonadales bacterium]|nr:type II secretion system protein [Gemmatimonadales bacterium]